MARAWDGPHGPSLAIVRGPERGTIFPLLLRETLVGRIYSNHLVVDDRAVSRVHARLTLGDAGVRVEDLGSRRGTIVNGQRLTAPALLSDGDELVVGELAFIFAASSGSAREG